MSSSSLSGSSCSSSQPDLSSSSLLLSPESARPPRSCPRPVYNKQISDLCIIRVTVESVSNGNVYKSILVSSAGTGGVLLLLGSFADVGGGGGGG